ncbi:MAG: M23 family metallopeptidase [Deltaproteobacteria bacterium]|nr:MAG: M23 family metallopeptidase [Deltaproteobacteria bacterium]
MKIGLLLLFLISCSSTQNKKPYTPYKVSLKPGEVKLVSFKVPKANPLGKVYCNNQEIPYVEKDGKMIIFLAESYFSKLKPFSCNYLEKKTQVHLANINVVEKKFPFEKLNVDKKKVFYSKKDLKRIIRESEKLKIVYGGSKKDLFQGPFELPLRSKVTSIYGTKRLFNNNKKSQHLGTDYRAKVGTPIRVSNGGKVALAEDLFFTGNTVIIDHGLGVFTMYGHLSKISVKVGEHVTNDRVVGLSGMTGRVTGPHLHWGVKVHGHWVDGNSLVLETEKL